MAKDASAGMTDSTPRTLSRKRLLSWPFLVLAALVVVGLTAWLLHVWRPARRMPPPGWRVQQMQTREPQHEDDLIPRRVCFTYHDREAIPPRIVDAIAEACGDIPFHIFDDTEALQYLAAHFGASFANQFVAFPTGAHKADLFRYAWLYREGGVYCDIKTKFTKAVDKMFPWTTRRAMCTVLSAIVGTIYQGVLASYAHNPHLEEALHQMEGISPDDLRQHYLLFTQQLYVLLTSAATTASLLPGWNTLRDQPLQAVPATTTALLLYTERCHQSCAQRDRYGLCCHIVDQEGVHVCDVRHADFPWPSHVDAS